MMLPLVGNAALLVVTISLFVATLRLRPKPRTQKAPDDRAALK